MRTKLAVGFAVWLTVLLGVAVLGIAMLVAPLRQRAPLPPPPVTIHSQGPTIERLEQLSQLVTTCVYIADVLVGEGEGCKGAWLTASVLARLFRLLLRNGPTIRTPCRHDWQLN